MTDNILLFEYLYMSIVHIVVAISGFPPIPSLSSSCTRTQR